MLKKLLIAASLMASTSAFATVSTISFSGLIDPLPASNYNTGNYAFYNIDTSFLAAGSLFDLSGSASAVSSTNVIFTNGSKALHDVALFNGSVQVGSLTTSSTNGTFNFSALNLIAGDAYQLRFNITSGSYSNGAHPTLTSTINGNFNISPIATVTPVPEPETYGMMFAGLVLMGTIAFRRQKNS